jgi:hypothetical protein
MAPDDPAATTTEEMLATSDELWRALDARDWDRWFARAQPDFVLRTDPRWPDGGEFRGREEILRFMGSFLDPWESLRYERRAGPERVGDRMLEEGSWLGTGRTTGIDGRIDFSVVGEFREGLMSRLEFFIVHEEAQEYLRTGVRPD